jgi:hypothetical protein
MKYRFCAAAVLLLAMCGEEAVPPVPGETPAPATGEQEEPAVAPAHEPVPPSSAPGQPPQPPMPPKPNVVVEQTDAALIAVNNFSQYLYGQMGYYEDIRMRVRRFPRDPKGSPVGLGRSGNGLLECLVEHKNLQIEPWVVEIVLRDDSKALGPLQLDVFQFVETTRFIRLARQLKGCRVSKSSRAHIQFGEYLVQVNGDCSNTAYFVYDVADVLRTLEAVSWGDRRIPEKIQFSKCGRWEVEFHAVKEIREAATKELAIWGEPVVEGRRKLREESPHRCKPPGFRESMITLKGWTTDDPKWLCTHAGQATRFPSTGFHKAVLQDWTEVPYALNLLGSSEMSPKSCVRIFERLDSLLVRVFSRFDLKGTPGLPFVDSKMTGTAREVEPDLVPRFEFGEFRELPLLSMCRQEDRADGSEATMR